MSKKKHMHLKNISVYIEVLQLSVENDIKYNNEKNQDTKLYHYKILMKIS